LCGIIQVEDINAGFSRILGKAQNRKIDIFYIFTRFAVHGFHQLIAKTKIFIKGQQKNAFVHFATVPARNTISRLAKRELSLSLNTRIEDENKIASKLPS
jgi:hypothetical protein